MMKPLFTAFISNTLISGVVAAGLIRGSEGRIIKMLSTKNSPEPNFSRDNVPVTLDNPQSMQLAVSLGLISNKEIVPVKLVEVMSHTRWLCAN